MTIETVLPLHNTNPVLSPGYHEIPPRPAASPGVDGNVATFANTFRARVLSSGCFDLDAIFEAAGQKYDISPDLLKAVAKVESSFRADATSPVGAMGIMQLMPGTARYLGVTDPYDPEQSIMAGAKYLKEQLDRFEGDVKLALAAYNAGWPAVVKHGGIPPFRETQAYVPKVLSHLTNGDEITPSMLTYNGFDMTGVINEMPYESNNNNGSFNVNEALAQMLYHKMIEMQMSSQEN